MPHSARAKANMTRQIKGILSFLERDLKSTKAARDKIKRYSKLPGYQAMKRAYDNDIAKTVRDIKSYKTLYNKYLREGKVN